MIQYKQYQTGEKKSQRKYEKKYLRDSIERMNLETEIQTDMA